MSCLGARYLRNEGPDSLNKPRSPTRAQVTLRHGQAATPTEVREYTACTSAPRAGGLWMKGDLEFVVYQIGASPHERIAHPPFSLLGSYNPIFAAAFSRKSEPSRMYLRRVATERWPVWAIMARSGTPAAAAAVARPARSEWPA